MGMAGLRFCPADRGRGRNEDIRACRTPAHLGAGNLRPSPSNDVDYGVSGHHHNDQRSSDMSTLERHCTEDYVVDRGCPYDAVLEAGRVG